MCFEKKLVQCLKAYKIADLLIYCLYTFYIIRSTENNNAVKQCTFPS